MLETQIKGAGIFTTDRTDLENGCARATKSHLRSHNIDVPSTHSRNSAARSRVAPPRRSLSQGRHDHTAHSIVLPRMHRPKPMPPRKSQEPAPAPTQWRVVESLQTRGHSRKFICIYQLKERSRCRKHFMRGKLNNRKGGILKC